MHLRAHVLLWSVWGATAAMAQDPVAAPVALTWDAPAECPQAADVLRRIMAHLPAPGGRAVRRFVVSGTVSRSGDASWHLALETQTESGTRRRSLDAPDCVAAADAAAVIVALAITSEPAVPQLEQAPAPAGTEGQEYLVRPSFLVRAWGLPAPVLGYGVTLGAARPPWRLELGVAHFVPQLLADGPRSGTGGVFGFPFAADLRVCRTWRWAALEPGACAGATGGLSTGRGAGLVAPTSASGAWAGASASVELAWAFTRVLSVRLEAALAAVPVHPDYVIDSFGTAYRPPLLVPGAGLGLEARLP